MKNKIADRVNRVSPSGIRKFFELVIGVDDVLSLAVGEPDFVTPWRIREACIFALESGYTSYTSNWGLLELREMLSEKLKLDYGVEYDAETQILVTTGVSEGLDLAIRTVINPGDEVIVVEPAYVSYCPSVVFAGGTPIIVPTNERNGFRPSAKQIEGKITKKTKALILNYPNNPTGSVMKRDELKEIADVAEEHGLLVISDEVYAKLTYESRHTCFASLLPERTLLLNGFSKAYAMTGFRLGYACAPPDIAEAMMKVHQYIMMCAPITAQMAAIEALKSEDDVREMVAEYNRRRLLIVGGLRKTGLRCTEPKGAFYAFPCIKQFGMDSEDFAARLLKEEKVAIVPGSAFGESGEGYLRVSYAAERETIKEALERIGNFVGRI